VLCSLQDHLRTGTRNLDRLIIAGAKNIVPMVPSSALTVATDDEHLWCGGFPLGETIHFGSLEFITDHFGGLSLSPLGDGSDAIIMGSAHDGPLSPLRAVTGDSVEEFHTTSDGEGRINLPSPRSHGTGALCAPTTAISWPESTLTA
jgi:hypothetical protein